MDIGHYVVVSWGCCKRQTHKIACKVLFSDVRIIHSLIST